MLDLNEPLAEEWTVVALGPHAGAFLVATDQREFDPAETSLEAARQFRGRWGYSRTQTAVELARLRLALGRRLDPDLAEIIDGLLATAMPSGGAAAASSGAPGETWATTSLHHMVDLMQNARAGTRRLREQLADAHAAAAARGAAAIEPQSGLSTPDFLVCDDIAGQLEFASKGLDGSLVASIATVVTPARPLPVTALLRALDAAPAGGPHTASTADGDRITVLPVRA